METRLVEVNKLDEEEEQSLGQKLNKTKSQLAGKDIK
jgi:hypothetical protein